MELRIQIIIIVTAVLVLLSIFHMIKKNRLELKYALSWMLLDVVIIIFTGFPKLIALLAELMGIVSPVNMLFFLGFCFSLILLFRLNATVSRLSNKVTRLTQQIAILEEQVKRTSNDDINE